MYIAKPLALLSLMSASTAYMIDAYTGPGCTGDMMSINVYDNTCRNTNIPQDGIMSFKATAYGGAHQMAFFYSNTQCTVTAIDSKLNVVKVPHWTYWVDNSAGTKFKDSKDNSNCIDLPSYASALGSQFAT